VSLICKQQEGRVFIDRTWVKKEWMRERERDREREIERERAERVK
jgi:hypothetical protein